MAARVVITFESVLSRLTARVNGSLSTGAPAILLGPSLFGRRPGCSGALLRRALRLPALHRRGWRDLLQNAVQLGIHVIESHLDIGHALGERYYIGARRHAHLLQHLEHGLLDGLARRRRRGEVGIENRAAS